MHHIDSKIDFITNPFKLSSMKKIYIFNFIILCLFLTYFGQAQQSWSVVGNAGFSSGRADYISLAFGPNGNPYVAYAPFDNTRKTSVSEWTGTAWAIAGNPDFSAGYAETISMAFSPVTGEPYVAFVDYGNSFKATVMKLPSGSSTWVNVGNAGFTPANADHTSLAFNSSGEPYVAFGDGAQGGRASVMKYTGGAWQYVGSAGFSAAIAGFTCLAFNLSTNTPYVAFKDHYYPPAKVTVMKYTGGSGSGWANVGSPGFSQAEVYNPSLAFNPVSNEPYLAYVDYLNSTSLYQAMVKRFDGTAWTDVGTNPICTGNVEYTRLVFNQGGEPYVGFIDGANSNKATVMKFNGNAWNFAGLPGFSAGSVAYPDIKINPNGLPYIGFMDMANSMRATVMSFDSSSSSICGYKFNDLNGNNFWDAGEPGLPGWTILLSGGLSVTTGVNGEYCFHNLAPGTYTVSEVPQDCWHQTAPASGYYMITLVPGQTITDLIFGNQQDICIPPPTGMVAWWPLDETTVTNNVAHDIAGSHLDNGTYYGNTFPPMPMPCQGKVANGLQFDGMDDFIGVPDGTDLNFGTGDFSIDAWIKTPDTLGTQFIIDKRLLWGAFLNNWRGYALFLSNGTLFLQLADYSWTNYNSSIFVGDGKWHHIAVAVTRNDPNGIRFFLDGVCISNKDPLNYVNHSLTNTETLRIGVPHGIFLGGFFHGILDEIELFNRALDTIEIHSIFMAGCAGKCKDTLSPQTCDSCEHPVLNLHSGFGSGIDSRWRLIAAPSGVQTGPANIVTNYTSWGLWPSMNYSKWISPPCTSGSPCPPAMAPGQYKYQIQFDIPGCPSGYLPQFRMCIMADSATILLNGNYVGTANSQMTVTNFTLNPMQYLNYGGANTLQVILNNPVGIYPVIDVKAWICCVDTIPGIGCNDTVQGYTTFPNQILSITGCAGAMFSGGSTMTLSGKEAIYVLDLTNSTSPLRVTVTSLGSTPRPDEKILILTQLPNPMPGPVDQEIVTYGNYYWPARGDLNPNIYYIVIDNVNAGSHYYNFKVTCDPVPPCVDSCKDVQEYLWTGHNLSPGTQDPNYKIWGGGPAVVINSGAYSDLGPPQSGTYGTTEWISYSATPNTSSSQFVPIYRYFTISEKCTNPYLKICVMGDHVSIGVNMNYIGTSISKTVPTVIAHSFYLHSGTNDLDIGLCTEPGSTPAVNILGLVCCSGGPQEINELSAEKPYMLYPNPADEWLILETKADVELITIYNSLGKKMFEATSIKNNLLIDVRKFDPGIYVVVINTGKGSFKEKVIVTR